MNKKLLTFLNLLCLFVYLASGGLSGATAVRIEEDGDTFLELWNQSQDTSVPSRPTSFDAAPEQAVVIPLFNGILHRNDERGKRDPAGVSLPPYGGAAPGSIASGDHAIRLFVFGVISRSADIPTFTNTRLRTVSLLV